MGQGKDSDARTKAPMESEPSEDPGMNKSPYRAGLKGQRSSQPVEFYPWGQRELLTDREWSRRELVSSTAAYARLFCCVALGGL